MLGIARATLYAYVSRRGIRSVPVEGARERRYWRADIEATKGARGRPKAQPQRARPAESAISLIGPDALFYRGSNAVDLSVSSTLEEVAGLLWAQPAERLFTDRLPAFPPTVLKIAEVLKGSPAVTRAAAMLPLFEEANLKSYDFSPAGMAASGADVVRSLAAVMLGMKGPSAAPIHEQVGNSLDLSPEWQDFTRRMLVLSADHGFEPSSYAVRGVASIGVSPYRCVTAGLLLTAGRRTQMGRFNVIERLLAEICDGDPEHVIRARLRDGDGIPGFGYHIYTRGDPRARALLEQLDDIMGDAVPLARLKRAIHLVKEAADLCPDFALITQFAGRQFLRNKLDSLFVLGRSVGWIAHSIEQYGIGEPVRTRAFYTGPLPNR